MITLKNILNMRILNVTDAEIKVMGSTAKYRNNIVAVTLAITDRYCRAIERNPTGINNITVAHRTTYESGNSLYKLSIQSNDVSTLIAWITLTDDKRKLYDSNESAYETYMRIFVSNMIANDELDGRYDLSKVNQALLNACTIYSPAELGGFRLLQYGKTISKLSESKFYNRYIDNCRTVSANII